MAVKKPEPQVLVPAVFDFPPLAARTRMLVPAYELMFGKLARRNLWGRGCADCVEAAGRFSC